MLSCEYNFITPNNQLPEQVSFTKHIQPFFNNHCTSCHSVPSVPPVLLENQSYEQLNGKGYINVANPKQSALYVKINAEHPNALVPNEYQRKLVLKWIQQGATKN